MCSISVAVSSRNSSGLEAITGREAFPLRLWALKICQEGFFSFPFALPLSPPALPSLTCPGKLLWSHFSGSPEGERINPHPGQVGRCWIRVPVPAQPMRWDIPHTEPSPVANWTRGVQDHPPWPAPSAPSTLSPAQNSVVPLAEGLCPERASGSVALALPLPPALCLVSPLGHFPAQTPGWGQKHVGFTERQSNVWDKAPSREDVRVTLPGLSALARTGLKLAPKSTAWLIAHSFHGWVNN